MGDEVTGPTTPKAGDGHTVGEVGWAQHTAKKGRGVAEEENV